MQAELAPAGRERLWPKGVGMSVEETQEVILNQKPSADIEVGRWPETLKANRVGVRIFVDTVWCDAHHS